MKNTTWNFTKSIALAFALSAFHFTNAQEWTKELKPGCTFSDIQKAFYENYKSDERQKVYGAENKDNEEYLIFKRWENFVKNRLDSTGHFASEQLWKEFTKTRSEKDQQTCTASNWTFVGPKNVPANGGGMGRLNTLEFEPGNP